MPEKKDTQRDPEDVAPAIPNAVSQPMPETLSQIINVAADRIDQIIKLVTSVSKHTLEVKKAESRFRVHMSWVAAVIVLIIIGVAGLLTYHDKIDGSTFGFLLGTVVGYVLTFIRDAVYPPTE